MAWLFHRWLLACCILILVYKDSYCLFLRHYKSGKCIAAGYLFSDTEYAKRYWAEMIDECLNVSAQFRYYNELLKNIETGGTFLSHGGGIYKNRFVLYKGKPILGIFENSTVNNLRQTPAGSLYRYNGNVYAAPSKRSKYVDEITGGCSDLAHQLFSFGCVTKFNAKIEDASCSSSQHMLIQKADYGDFNKSGTFDFDASIDTKCSSLTTCKVKHLCGGNRSCKLAVNADLLSPYCTDDPKELYTEYICVNIYSFTITEAPKVMLSDLPNKGVLVINDGTIWRKVDDKSWDKERQGMLCQHLGFDKAYENYLSTKSLGSGEDIAIGDLLCYDTQSNGTSCCVHLKPSKTSESTQIPYVTCKICDHPLDLWNKQKFPDAAFSGSGGEKQYHLARLNSLGWCSWTPKTSYLLIDLQKDHHITRIVIMGDKFQKKWSRSYSLKFSHNKTMVDKSNKIKIIGNQYGFKASSTTLKNIFNVRYVNIQSTGIEEFCLRIEFCGNVQKPAAVHGISITPSNFSARVSCSLKTARYSSYITEFDIYLNNKYFKTISRIPGNHANIQYLEIDKLQPNTDYTVGILPRDGSSQSGEIIYKHFTTTEAVKHNGENSELSSDDKTHMNLLIPLCIVSFCFLVLLGVLICCYANQRRRPRKDNGQPSHESQASRDAEPNQRETIEYDDIYENMEYVVPNTRQDLSNVSDETTYASPDEVSVREERNTTEPRPGHSAGPEDSDNNSLNDVEGSANFHRPLLHHSSTDDQHHAKETDNYDQTEEEESSDYMPLNDIRETENVYKPLNLSACSPDHHSQGDDHRDQAIE